MALVFANREVHGGLDTSVRGWRWWLAASEGMPQKLKSYLYACTCEYPELTVLCLAFIDSFR